jgi:NAD/NADP transhydrogenase alpha subunit
MGLTNWQKPKKGIASENKGEVFEYGAGVVGAVFALAVLDGGFIADYDFDVEAKEEDQNAQYGQAQKIKCEDPEHDREFHLFLRK